MVEIQGCESGGAVDFFVQHHNFDNIKSDIEAGCVYMKCDDSNQAVGTVTIKENEICRLFVLPPYQGKGYGRKLLDFAEEMIKGYSGQIILDASLPAKRIYLKRGYKEIEYHVIETENGDKLCHDVMKKEVMEPTEKTVYEGLLIKESISDENLLDLLTIHKTELWKTEGKPKYWTALFFTSTQPDFPQRASEVLVDNWYVDFKSENRKYIVFKNKVLAYDIGDTEGKKMVCEECRKLGIPEAQMDWAE